MSERNEHLEFGLTTLRIKIKHLALEPALIRHERRKEKARAWGGHNKAAIRKFKAHLRESGDNRNWVAALRGDGVARRDFRAIRKDLGIPNTQAESWQVQHLDAHRKGEVRTEARAAQTAYAYLRGQPFDRFEPTTRYPAHLDRVAELAVKFGPHTDKKLAKESLIAWITASGAWTWKPVGSGGYFERKESDKAAA